MPFFKLGLFLFYLNFLEFKQRILLLFMYGREVFYLLFTLVKSLFGLLPSPSVKFSTGKAFCVFDTIIYLFSGCTFAAVFLPLFMVFLALL